MKKSKIKHEIAHGTVTINSEGFAITYRHNLPNKVVAYTFINKSIDINNNLVTYCHNNTNLVTHYHRPKTYENLAALLDALNAEYAEIGYSVSSFDINEILIYTKTINCQESFWEWYVNQTDITIAQNAHMSLF